jgi:hypothetical protein
MKLTNHLQPVPWSTIHESIHPLPPPSPSLWHIDFIKKKSTRAEQQQLLVLENAILSIVTRNFYNTGSKGFWVFA